MASRLERLRAIASIGDAYTSWEEIEAMAALPLLLAVVDAVKGLVLWTNDKGEQHLCEGLMHCNKECLRLCRALAALTQEAP